MDTQAGWCMSELDLVALDGRAVVRIGGEDRFEFLQNLVSGDVARVEQGLAIWSALLTPQGKYLFDFFLYPASGSILLDVEAGRALDLIRRLMLYRLRARVTIEDESVHRQVFALLGRDAPAAAGLAANPGSCAPYGDGFAAVDSRVLELGVRLVHPGPPSLPGATIAPFSTWDLARLAAGVPDGTRDLIVDRTTLLEAGFDELGGISFEKGCYVGQELTARMKYRGLLKKRLFPIVTNEQALPEAGTPITGPAGEEVGEMRSSSGQLGLALLRIEAATGELTAGATRLEVRRPSWLAAA